jgi:hypothetical protein
MLIYPQYETSAPVRTAIFPATLASSVYSSWIINLDQLLAATEGRRKAEGAVG